MIYLRLFLVFLKVGAVSFGGGYGMIALIRELVLKEGWLTDDLLLSYIAVAESTPGPIAVNMATFVGMRTGGIPGALSATFGVVLPAFLVVLCIAAVLKNFLKNRSVQACFSGIRPCITALIMGTAVSMGVKVLLGLSTVKDKMTLDVRGVVILALILAVHFFCKKKYKKKPDPILMIVLSAGLGMVIYGLV